MRNTLFRRWSSCAFICLLLCSASLFAGPVTGIAVLGDSVADEYQFAQIIEPGGDRRLARSFTETLTTTRSLDFGPLSNVSRGVPRNEGFEYNWAQEGERSDELIANGQHTGAAAQAAAGKVNLAWMFIGGNDFRDLFDPAVVTSPDPGAAIQSKVGTLLTNVNVAVQTLLAANPSLNVVISNAPDLRGIPGLKAAIASVPELGLFAAAVDQGVQAYNAQIKSLADGSNRIAMVDAYGFMQAAVAGLPVVVDGFSMDTNVPGNGSTHFFVDAIHPNTMPSLILGNMFIEASNAEFQSGITPLTDREIRASVAAPIPLPAPVLSGMIGMGCAGIGIVRARRKAA